MPARAKKSATGRTRTNKNGKPKEPEGSGQGKGGGRPAFEFTPQMLQTMKQWAQAGRPDTDIALKLGCSVDTLTRSFADTLKVYRAERRFAIHAAGTQRALAGDAKMLLHYAQTELGQIPKQTVEHTTPEGEQCIILFGQKLIF